MIYGQRWPEGFSIQSFCQHTDPSNIPLVGESSLGGYYYGKIATDTKNYMEHNTGGLVQMIFLCCFVIYFRFHLNFQTCTDIFFQ